MSTRAAVPGHTSPTPCASLVLASASPRRAEILRAAGFDFDVAPSTAPEDALGTSEAPERMAVRLAEAKARQVAPRRPGAVVLAADTIVVADGQVLGKPSGPEEASQMLSRLNGRVHSVVTGVAVRTPAGDASGCRRSEVSFRTMSEERIGAYVATGSPLDKAGSYGIQDPLIAESATVSGCRLNVVGLPLCLVAELLEEARGPSGLSAGMVCQGCAPLPREMPS